MKREIMYVKLSLFWLYSPDDTISGKFGLGFNFILNRYFTQKRFHRLQGNFRKLLFTAAHLNPQLHFKSLFKEYVNFALLHLHVMDTYTDRDTNLLEDISFG